MESLKEFGEFAWSFCIDPFIPTSKKKRENFLEQVKDRVAYYKPRIEDKCGIDLRDVKVRDNKFWLFEVSDDICYKNAIMNAWKRGKVPTELDFKRARIDSAICQTILIGPLFLFNVIRGADFRHHNGTIYVPFNYMNRFMDFNFRNRIKRLDYVVVHELSHTLWERIQGDFTNDSNDRLWFEGFATYCADKYFSDFYPKGTMKMNNSPSVYTKGKIKIENLVSKYGEDILLEIPKNGKNLKKILYNYLFQFFF